MEISPAAHYSNFKILKPSSLIQTRTSLQHLWPQVACSTGSRITKQQITHLSLFNSIAAELNPRMLEAPFLLDSTFWRF